MKLKLINLIFIFLVIICPVIGITQNINGRYAFKSKVLYVKVKCTKRRSVIKFIPYGNLPLDDRFKNGKIKYVQKGVRNWCNDSTFNIGSDTLVIQNQKLYLSTNSVYLKKYNFWAYFLDIIPESAVW